MAFAYHPSAAVGLINSQFVASSLTPSPWGFPFQKTGSFLRGFGPAFFLVTGIQKSETVMSSNNELGYTHLGSGATLPSLTQAGIDAAIAQLPASGGTVYLPSGLFVFSAALLISKPNVTLAGTSETATQIQFTYNGICIDVTAAAVELRDLTILGPDIIAAPASTAIRIRASDCSVRDVKVKGAAFAVDHYGAKGYFNSVHHAADGSSKNGTLLLCRSDVAGDNGLLAQNCTSEFAQAPAFDIRSASLQTTLSACRTTSHSVGAGVATPAFSLGGSEGTLQRVSVIDCSTSGFIQSIGLSFVSSGTQTVGTVKISDCVFSGATHAIDINCANKTSSLVVCNNVAEGSASNGIRIQNVLGTSGGVVLSGNKVSQGCALGTRLVATPRAAITGNAFYAAGGNGLLIESCDSPLAVGNVVLTAITSTALTNPLLASNIFT